MPNSAYSQDDDDDDDDDDGSEIIYEPVRYTPYDRRREELRELEEKRAKLAPDTAPHLVAVLDQQIVRAKERFEVEKKRGLDDGWRRWRRTDDWRKGEGREAYNTSRRAANKTFASRSFKLLGRCLAYGRRNASASTLSHASMIGGN